MNLKLFSILLFLAFPAHIFGQDREYALKSIHIEKFARFTNWPSTIDTLYITVIGKNPFGNELDNVAHAFTFNGKPIITRYIKAPCQIANSQVLFIPNTELRNIKKIIDSVKDKPILTIGESDECVVWGVHFIFYIADDGTLHFRVNPRTLKQSGLDTDVFLLNYGNIVK